ncbi:adenosylmethionine--8-amino-7-oxononanoate transaminase [Haloferula sp.]|uniref:adenosylmethionine--8-amino-7-oxononanoate transaminase n=1 Tax=Haloferula sp. TaxID=2497595 RepID=UPI003C72F535
MREDTRRWMAADKRHCWHPFTPQGAWTDGGHDPLVLVRGQGCWLWDSEGRKYFDGNSSIWTNIHGHNHPVLNEALRKQAEQVAHTSYLGFANPRASELAEKLVSFFPEQTLERVFYSDNGSTAVEVAMKMSLQYWMQCGSMKRTRFVAFNNGYHGDTMGAASLGGVSRFFERFRQFGVEVDFVSSIEDLEALDPEHTAAVIIEPLIQGVNEMRPWPCGMLKALRDYCDKAGVHLILDEVMTGFGRTGTMFACEQESVVPDFLCLAKGLTGGYMPMAATLTTREVYEAFLGDAENAFYYGHSYTANPLGCAVALANLGLFESENTLEKLKSKIEALSALLDALEGEKSRVHEVRQCGFIAGIELRQADGLSFPEDNKVGAAVCAEARQHGLLTRPIRDTVVIMPPLCTEPDELEAAFGALGKVL